MRIEFVDMISMSQLDLDDAAPLLRSTAEAELDAEVEAEQVGAVLVLASNVNVELARWDLSRQGNGLLELVVAGGDWALDLGVVFPRLLANVESTSEEPDETELDHDVGKCSVLNMSQVRKQGKSCIKCQQSWIGLGKVGHLGNTAGLILTLTSSLTVPLARTVRFWPGTGGSGLTTMLSTSTTSLPVPQLAHCQPCPGVGSNLAL